MYIQSTKNDRVKQWKKLFTKRGRKKEQKYIIEGFHLIDEAIKRYGSITELIMEESCEVDNDLIGKADKIFTISREVSEEISKTENSQGIFAVVEIEEMQFDNKVEGPFLFLDSVQDPGNVGTMIRTADAAGFAGVVLGEGTVDLYNDKTLRSAQGSHFHMPIFSGDLSEWIKLFQSKNIVVFGTALDQYATPFKQVSSRDEFALILGNEGNGMQEEILKLTDQNLYIPIHGEAESLNVAVAAGILMYSLIEN
ncbi:TrmH family RNA methyltransferase [Lacticigenium naphthae]|uniref:TrmH family RNA methyltransferase n=1 Tax=Lacticigenium naphthae TaxID=515351 RepID=UPI00040E2784|nr:RNA methyltransferase [Lacticigenium naphthae]